MQKSEFKRRFPALVERYAEVAQIIDRPRSRQTRKVSHRAVLDEFMATRSYLQTSRAFGISDTTVWNIVYRGIRIAEHLKNPIPRDCACGCGGSNHVR